MSKSSVTWGAPRIRDEMGSEVAVSTIARYMVRQRRPPSPSWRAFLENCVKDVAASDYSRDALDAAAPWTSSTAGTPPLGSTTVTHCEYTGHLM